jgi:hypothetical protein
MSWNVSWGRALRAVLVAGLLLALICAVLGSIGLKTQPWSWHDRAGAPEASPRGMTFGTTVPR